MKILKAKRYQLWSAKTISLLFLLTSVTAAILVFNSDKGSFFIKMEIALGIIAAILFLFLTAGLYLGIRLRKESIDVPAPEFSPELMPDGFSALSSLDDIAGIFGTIIFWIAITIIIGFMFPAILSGFFIILATLFWVFFRAMRQVFIKSRVCKGNLIESTKYGAQYTFLYTG